MSRLKPFAFLRAELLKRGIEWTDLGQLLGLGVDAISRRMNLHEPWRSTEMYKLMDELELPYELMHIVFPKNGYPAPEMKTVAKLSEGRFSRSPALDACINA